MFEFSIPGVRQAVTEMRSSNADNVRNKDAFLAYIDSELAPNWTTDQGKVAVAELRKFASERYQEYIDYLNKKINVLEEDVLPALEVINNA